MSGNKGILSRLRTISIGSAMADLALLLLVFFMAATSTEPPRGVEVELPRAETQAAEQESIYITVSKQGELYVDSKKTTLGDFSDLLAMRQGEKDKTVSITADRNLDYRIIASVLDTLRGQDFLNVVFMSESKKHRGGAR
ncbi:MAG: biopolymer transporter ExbD [Spirochaetes bacterium]|nr:biopolymer transporter ExbD [Spirochaetota bacterium]